jgi:hypothetical protein
MLRDEILKGVRIGSILLVGLLIAFTAYRLMHEAPAPQSAAPKPAPPAVVAKPAAPAVHLSGPAPLSVPPPPPVNGPARRMAHGRPQVATNTAPAIIEAPAPPVDVVELEMKPIDPPAEVKVDQADPQPFTPRVAAVPVPTPAPSDPLGPDTRGKRWVKAVGHFLHIGKKDVQPDAVRQQ